MSYTPVWTERAREMRQVLDRIDFERPASMADEALYKVARHASASIRESFPDVSRELLGWVYLDAASGVREVISFAPGMPPQRIPALLMVIGKALLEGVPRP